MKEAYSILVINPGSTSTKAAIYGGCAELHEIKSAALPADLMAPAAERLDAIDKLLADVEAIDCVAARGGMVRPLPSGIYEINQSMIDDLESCVYGSHASNLGAVLAREIANKYACPAIIADPVGVEEFKEMARFSGLRGIERKSFSHALNIRATARRAADECGLEFRESKFVVAHLGGGISVAAVEGGKIIDVNNSNEGGPFTPQRTGTLPVLQLVDLCYSGEYRHADDLKRMLTTEGGLSSYLGTDSVREVLRRIDGGDDYARRVLHAMVYQMGKEIGAMASVLRGRVDAVLLTGGFARPPVTDWLSAIVDWIAPVRVFPGEHEMTALAAAALRFLTGVETLRRY